MNVFCNVSDMSCVRVEEVIENLFGTNPLDILQILNGLEPSIANLILNTPIQIGDNDVFEERCTLPQLAILTGKSSLAAELLKHSCCDVNVQQNCSFFAWGDQFNASGAGLMERVSALWCAAYCGDAPLVRLLGSLGAHINAQTVCGTTPLKITALNGHVSVLEELLSMGADPYISSSDGSLPIHAASWSSRSKQAIRIVDLLLDTVACSPTSPSCSSSTQEHYVNSLNRNHESPAFIACGVSLPLLRHLVKKGADLRTSDSRGRSCLVRAVLQGKLDVVQYLVQQLPLDEILCHVTKSGKTALDFALELGNAEMVEQIRSAAVKPMVGDGGETARQPVRFYI